MSNAWLLSRKTILELKKLLSATPELASGGVDVAELGADATLLINHKEAEVADGTIPAKRLVMLDASANLVVGTVSNLKTVGISTETTQKVATDAITIQRFGKCTGVSASPIKAGASLKCADGGRLTQLVDASTAAAAIASSTGGNFGNQPANDTVSIVSSSAADTTRTVTITGTTNGGVVVVQETKTLTGTGAVDTTKTDWDIVLGVELSGACAGTITIKEKSGGLTITTIAPASLSAGVTSVTAASQGAFNVIPAGIAAGASTKVIGVQYTANDLERHDGGALYHGRLARHQGLLW
jgi:hypothetical protein